MAVSTLEVPEDLADQIAKQLVVAKDDNVVSTASVSDFRKQFCELWPLARQALGFLKDIVPGGGFIIGTVIAIGDGAHKAFC